MYFSPKREVLDELSADNIRGDKKRAEFNTF